MILTIDEARTRECPQPFPRESGRTYCCADLCMAWRWEDPALHAAPIPGAYVSEDLTGPRGYCGLVGQLQQEG
jgi:hypothetical protein